MDATYRRGRLNRKLALIYLLNIVDWFCTVVLLRTERFFEANPLMRRFIGSDLNGFLLKCVFPAAVITAIAFALRMLSARELNVADRFISFALVFYTAISLDHIANFFLLLLSVK